MDIKQTAIGFYGERLQQLASDLQGLGYSLNYLHGQTVSPMAQGPSSSEMLNIVGTISRLKTQLDYVLIQVQELLLKVESQTPGTLKK